MVQIIASFVGLIYAILLFTNPRITFNLLILLSIFDLGFLSRWIGISRYFARIPYFIAIIMAISFILEFLSKRNTFNLRDKIPSQFIRFLSVLTILTLISGLYNGEDLLLGIFELRYFYFLFIFFYGFYLYRSSFLKVNNFIYFCITVSLIQIPFTVIQYSLVQFFNIRLSYSALDMSSGTFSSYPPLIILQCTSLACLLEYNLTTHKNIFRLNKYLLSFLIIVPLLLSYSRSAMGFVILTIFIVYLKTPVKNLDFSKLFKNILTMTMICFILVFGFINAFWNQHYSLKEQLSPKHLVEYFFRDAKNKTLDESHAHPVMGRGKAVLDSVNIISNNMITTAIGLGSGSTSEAKLLKRSGAYYQEWGPLAGIGRTEVSKKISELGFIGLILICYFFFKLYRFSKTYSSAKKEIDLLGKIFIDFLFILMSVSFYSTVLSNQIVICILGFITAIIYKNETGFDSKNCQH